MLNSTRKTALGGIVLMAFLFLSSTVFSQASVSGRCTDKNGVALKGVQVATVQFDDRHTTETNGDGYYEDRNLAPGEWTIIYVYQDQKIVKKVTVKDAQTRLEMNITFTVGDTEMK